MMKFRENHAGTRTGSTFFFAAVVTCVMSSCVPTATEIQVEDGESTRVDTLTLALDWSPNVLHAGIFLADHLGWYRDAGVHLSWYTTEVDNYQRKPVQRIVAGEVDLAIAPSEHLFYFRADDEGYNPLAIATLLQEGCSSFCLKTSEEVGSPGDLKDYTYVGYHTPLEKAILQAMAAHAGGDFELPMETPGRLQVWDAFMEAERRVAWIFRHWEGALAEQAGVELTCFDPEDHGVPYGYSSVVVATPELVQTRESAVRAFLQVTERGYREVVSMQPEPLSAVLYAAVPHPNFADPERIKSALDLITGAFLGEDSVWGHMQAEVWADYLNWIEEAVPEQIPEKMLLPDVYFTNRFFEEMDSH